MIESVLIATGAVVWIVIGITLALWLPVVLALAIGWITYKSQRALWLRDKCVAFLKWYADHVLKPIFDPVVKLLTRRKTL